MFTGIIRHLGTIRQLSTQGENLHLRLSADFGEPIRVDQSIAHNGVCLTVAKIWAQEGNLFDYEVVAVRETLEKTNLNDWKVGEKVNLELCMRPNDRLDGHFVQGHVDTVGKLLKIEERDGSWMIQTAFDQAFTHLLVDKGSVCISGVSLTVVKANETDFWVTIIPYTYEHTIFHQLKVGDAVNLEFDILGKYIARMVKP